MSESSTVAGSEIPPNQEPTMSIDIKAAAGEQESLQDTVRKLEHELQIQTEEKENFKNRFQATEKELADLKNAIATQEAEIANTEPDETTEKIMEDNNTLREALNKAAELIKDKTTLCQSQERQIVALTNQVISLKEVIAITKDLLNIRNMEVKHLQSDVDSMEEKIKAERERHNTMISKMEEAVKLNSELKTEYENQLTIFQDLKARYEEKVYLLELENVRQKAAAALQTKSATNNKNEQDENNTTEEEQENKPKETDIINNLDNKKGRRLSFNRSDSVNSDDNIDEFVDAHDEIAGN